MKRKEFVQTVCPVLILTMLSSPILVSCATDEISPETPLSEEEKNYQALITMLNEDGYYTEGKKLHIDLKNTRYKDLDQLSAFVNDLENGLLILRKDEENYMAFDNCCPHLGSRNLWTYNNNKFRCNNHGNSFGTSSGLTSYCSSNSNSGNLKQYAVSVYEDLLTVDFSS